MARHEPYFRMQVSAARYSIIPREKRLMLAVIERAIDDIDLLWTRSTVGETLAAEAWKWFASDDLDHVFSFENVCAALGLDPDAVRGAMAATMRAASRRH